MSPSQEWVEETMEAWESHAYTSVGVPDYYLPATEFDEDVIDGVTELKAPIGTREQLAGAWYGHRAASFWGERLDG